VVIFVGYLSQVVNCKVGMMKSQKDAGGLFALVAMEKLDDVNTCIGKLNQTLFRGKTITVVKVRASFTTSAIIFKTGFIPSLDSSGI